MKLVFLAVFFLGLGTSAYADQKADEALKNAVLTQDGQIQLANSDQKIQLKKDTLVCHSLGTDYYIYGVCTATASLVNQGGPGDMLVSISVSYDDEGEAGYTAVELVSWE